MSADTPRRSLLAKYFVILFSAVALPLVANAGLESYFWYHDQRNRLDELLTIQADGASERISAFVESVRGELGWTVQLGWDDITSEQHRLDALRVLRQAPAIASIALVDPGGTERLFVSRLALDRSGSGADRKDDSAFLGARADKVWFGPVTFRNGSEPHMTVAVAGNRAAAGVSIADVNLKFVGDVVSNIRIGNMGHAFVLDSAGRIIAHPDVSLVLRGNARFVELRAPVVGLLAPDHAMIARTTDSDARLVALSSPVRDVDWKVIVEQPLAEAFAPLRYALYRTLGLLFGGAVLAFVLAFVLARRMTEPIGRLGEGARRIGAGEFDHRIQIHSGDELEDLAGRFNAMAAELAISQEKSERINRLKRFLAPQVAELVERSRESNVLDGQRREVVVIFADLRGFTAFSAHTDPESIMRVLGEYYEACGAIISGHGVTLTSFAGDGFMLLVNAPLTCDDPAGVGARVAIEMQRAVGALIPRWHMRGYQLGFGIGMAYGTATVGRVGYEGRLEYTAIGDVVNLASRLCSVAEPGQILLDAVLGARLEGRAEVTRARQLRVKGYEQPIATFALVVRDHDESRAQARAAER